MSRTRIGSILESANTVDILLYISEHPGCFKSEIYQNVTRNAHTREKIARLCEEGLVSAESTATKKGNILSLTYRGRDVVELLKELERILES